MATWLNMWSEIVTLAHHCKKRIWMVEIALSENMLSKPFKFERPQPEPGRLMSTAGRTCFKHFKSSLRIFTYLYTVCRCSANDFCSTSSFAEGHSRWTATRNCRLCPSSGSTRPAPGHKDNLPSTTEYCKLCSSQISLGIGKKVWNPKDSKPTSQNQKRSLECKEHGQRYCKHHHKLGNGMQQLQNPNEDHQVVDQRNCH